MLLPLIADPTARPSRNAAPAASSTSSRLREFDDERLPVALIAVGTAAILLLVWYLYRRDTRELPRGVGLLLAAAVRGAGRAAGVLPRHRAAHDARGRAQFAGRRAGRRQPEHGPHRRRPSTRQASREPRRAGGRRARRQPAHDRAAASTTT